MFGWLKKLFGDKEAEARKLRMMAAAGEIAAGVARALEGERKGVDTKLRVGDVESPAGIRYSKRPVESTGDDGRYSLCSDMRYQRREEPSGGSRYSLSIRPGAGTTGAPKVADFSQVKKAKTFAQRLNELVNANCGGVPSDCYRRAGVQRQTYSKIISTGGRNVSKRIAMQLCVGAKASIREAIELLESAGYAFSKASYEDAVFRWCLENGVYSMMYVNELLVHCNCKPCELVW